MIELLPEYRDITVTQVKRGRGHRYKVEGPGVKHELSSVTTFLNIIDKSGPLLPWARRVAVEKMVDRLLAIEPGNLPGEDDYEPYIREIAEEARKQDTTGRDEGAAAHALIEEQLTGRAPDFPISQEMREKVHDMVEGGVDVLYSSRLAIEAVEFPIWHPQYLYGGTIDLITRDPEDRLVVVDWKRSAKRYPEHGTQVVAYRAALIALTGLDPEQVRAFVIRLPRDHTEPPADGAYVRRQDLDKLFGRFILAKGLHQNVNDKEITVWE